MRKIFLLCAAAILITSCLFPGPVSCEVVDKIAVIVNNEIITQREIDKMLEPVFEQYRAIYYGDELIARLEAARNQIIEQLIEDRLVLSEARKMNIEVDDKEVDARLESVQKQFGPNEVFEKVLSEQGISVRELKARYKEQIMRRKLVDQKVGSKITITPVEINNYYNKHMNEFIQPEAVKLRNILIRPKKDEPLDKTLELANDISKRVKDGCDFAGLAKEYSEGPYASEGGLMGYVKKGDLLPEIEVVVFNLKEGESSDIIQSNLGYHIFQVEEKRDRRIRDLSEVRSDIEETIFREKIKDKLKGWIESLRKNAYIAFK